MAAPKPRGGLPTPAGRIATPQRRMARSHVLVALGTALLSLFILGQLVINLGFPQIDFWHWRLDHHDYGFQQTHGFGGKQSGDVEQDPSQYLIGVGRADITG